jgi:hypothetical protein
VRKAQGAADGSHVAHCQAARRSRNGAIRRLRTAQESTLFRLPLIEVLAVYPVLAILPLFLFDALLAFFALLTAVAHDSSLLQSHAKLFGERETLPNVPPPEKPPVPNEEPPKTTPPVMDPPPDLKTDPTAIDPDDAQIEPPKDDAFKKK